MSGQSNSSNANKKSQRNVQSTVPRASQNQQVNAVHRNRNTKSTESIQPQSYIRLVRLPFYTQVSNVIKATTLVGKEMPMKVGIEKRDMRRAEFIVQINVEQVNYISLNRDIDEYPYQLQLRICELKPSSTYITDFLPCELRIQINNHICELPPVIPPKKKGHPIRRMAYPIDCTPYFKLSPIHYNKILVDWMPDETNYIMTLNIVKKLNSSILLDELQKKPQRSSELTKKYIIKIMKKTDADLDTTCQLLSLICPLSKTRMSVPVKSIKCSHLQCFDASMFLSLNEIKPTWLCPTCHEPCLYEDLQIESYLLDVVTSPRLPSWCNEIELLADGSWRVYEENADSVTTVGDGKQLMEFITLDD